MIKMNIYCSNCGYLNKDNEKYCIKCNEILHNFSKLNINKTINSTEELFSNEVITQLNNCILTIDSYEMIIENIIETGSNHIIYKKNMTPLERIKAVAEAYSIVISKDDGRSYGEYAYNVICIDENFDSAIQIATLLHELTHHLFNEIIKQIVMYTLEIKKTPIIDSLIQVISTLPSILLISEYCASSTEKRYLPEEYVSYSSFNHICEDLNYNKQILIRTLIIGKGLNDSIERILNTFIDDVLKEDIKKEFVKNNTKPIANPICINDDGIDNSILRNVYLMNVIYENFSYLNTPENKEIVEKNANLFKKSYQKGAYG